jgi:DNA-binding CsgD family transcriptional regulator
MRIDDFISATNTATSQEEVMRLFVAALGEYGYDRFLYCALRGPGSDQPALARNYPDEWMKIYEARDYRINDPVRLKVGHVRGPITWASVMRGRLTSAQRLLMDEAEEFGLRDGIALPIYLPRGEVSGFGMASSVGHTDPAAHLSQLYMIGLQFHTVWSAMTSPAPPPAPKLTARELEVLKWCSLGKSNWAIGEIMAISEHGVHYHLRNILRKLAVDSRTTAVVKAYHLGLISL